MAEELRHKALAECHDFTVRLALRIKIGAAFAAADRQTRQAVFKDLLKSQKLQDSEVYARMETQAAFVGADCIVELYAVAAVYLHFAGVVHPCYTEADGTVGLRQALQNAGCLIFGVPCEHRLQRLQNFCDCLMEFRLSRVFLQNGLQYIIHVRHKKPPLLSFAFE